MRINGLFDVCLLLSYYCHHIMQQEPFLVFCTCVHLFIHTHMCVCRQISWKFKKVDLVGILSYLSFMSTFSSLCLLVLQVCNLKEISCSLYAGVKSLDSCPQHLPPLDFTFFCFYQTQESNADDACSQENGSYIVEESGSARQSLDESHVTGRYLFFSRDFSLCLLARS